VKSTKNLVGKELGCQALQSGEDPSAWLFFLEREMANDLNLGILRNLTRDNAAEICKLLDNTVQAVIFDYEERGENA